MKQVTMICTLVFDVIDSVDVEKVKGMVVEEVNQALIQSNLNCEPQIDPESPMVVTSISDPNFSFPNNEQVEILSIWSDIDTAFEDEEEKLIYVDAWTEAGGEEDGKVIAKVHSQTGEVQYFDERAKTDKYAQRMITELVEEIKKK